MAFEDTFRSLKVKGNFTHLGTSTRGSSSSPVTMSAAGNMEQLYVSSTATSGDSRANYTRLYLAGAAGAGEAVRAFTTVNNVAGDTAHGIHASLSFATSGSLTGLGAAARNTLQIVNGAMTNGTYCSTMAEIYSDGASSDVSGVTELSLIRAVLSGNATGLATVDDKAALIAISGNAIAGGNIIQAKSSAAVTHVARMLVNGTPYYIMLSNAV
jgi:hypothetical protein